MKTHVHQQGKVANKRVQHWLISSYVGGSTGEDANELGFMLQIEVEGRQNAESSYV